MQIDIGIDNEKITLSVDNAFRIDFDGFIRRISEFAASRGAVLDGLNLRDLLTRMVRGVAGCEKGCPADAKGLVRRGCHPFELAYVEGGILTAKAMNTDGRLISVTIFPDF